MRCSAASESRSASSRPGASGWRRRRGCAARPVRQRAEGLPWRRTLTGVTNLGHEAVGLVEDASRSRRWRVGDLVGVHAVWGCGACASCARGCSRTARADVRTGAHAEYLAAPDHVLLRYRRIRRTSRWTLLTGDALGVPFHAARGLRTRGGTRSRSWAAVRSAWAHPAPLLLRRAGHRARPAAGSGALGGAPGRRCDDRPSVGDPVAEVRERTGGRMAEAAVEASGTAEGVALALGLAGPGRPVRCAERRTGDPRRVP